MIKLKALITEMRSPHQSAKHSDPKRGYIGIVSRGVVYAYDEMVPDVWAIDHSEIEYGAGYGRFRYQASTNYVYWNYFPPADEYKEAIEEWLLKKGIHISGHRNMLDKLGVAVPPIMKKHQ